MAPHIPNRGGSSQFLTSDASDLPTEKKEVPTIYGTNVPPF